MTTSHLTRVFGRRGPIQRRLRPFVKRMIDHEWCGRIEYHLFPSHRQSWGGPLNGQQGRAELFRELIRGFAPQLIVETGTYRGTTTRFLAEAAPDVPILSVELSKRTLGFARRNVRDLRAVRLEAGDSRSLLRKLTVEPGIGKQRIFFYLDAHWGPDFPVVDELVSIFSACQDAIVAIDDFQVPDDAGYGFDWYDAERALTLTTVAPIIQKFGLTAFFPSLRAEEESGKRKGAVVLAGSPASVAMLKGLHSLREAR